MGETITNGTQNFRRSKSSDAYEDGSQPHRAGRDRNMGFFRPSRKIKYTLNQNTNYGEGSRRKHRVQNKMASWITRILTPLIQSNLC